jgi:hypothetical protein
VDSRGDTATSEDDLGARRVEEGLKRLTRGRRAYHHARMLVELAGASEDAEERARRSLGDIASAMNWLEDTPQFSEAHDTLHEVGAFTRSTFGCELHLEKGAYEERCPASLAHFRLGFSLGFIIREAHCSICEENIDKCLHVTGRLYDGQVCQRVITEAEVLEVSVVDRPKHPDARMTSMPVSLSGLTQALANTGWRPGMPVSCDKCLRPCKGFVSADEVYGVSESPHRDDSRRLSGK